MRIPLSWLAEYADLPAGTTPEALHAALVRVGFEEETVHGGELSGPVVVGEVLELTPEPQKNGKTIRWCSVRVAPDGERAADGGEAVRGIVCGAGNFHPGDKVVVTLPGAVLPGPFPIAARKTYGHVSDGMIASARELGLSEEHAGILRLTEIGLDPEVGTDAIALLGLDDAAVEINVTPDRGYALSIRGIAREYGASTGAAFRDPALEVAAPSTDDGAVRVAVDDATPIRGRQGCTVFVTRVVRGIDPTAPTPRWMANRLRLAGVRSISLPVDVTNYVMLEIGQPLHGYDLARLQGGLGVRRAKPGEPLTTLDGQQRVLDAEDLVITDDRGAIGLAGVMGGATTEISDTTVDVVIEAANFDPVSIGRTARRHRLPSEASRRFERGVDPAVARAAAQRAVDLLVEHAGGTADPGQTWFDVAQAPAPVLLPAGAVLRRTGAEIAEAETVAALRAIGCTVAPGEEGLLVLPPSWRRDLLEPVDVVEEVVRIVGYDRIPSVLPVAPPGRGLTRPQRLRRSIGTVLAATGGTEVQSYPLVSADRQAVYSPGPSMRVANPLDASAPLLRCSTPCGATARAGSPTSRCTRSGSSSCPRRASATAPPSCRPSARGRRRSCSSACSATSLRSPSTSAPCSPATGSRSSRARPPSPWTGATRSTSPRGSRRPSARPCACARRRRRATTRAAPRRCSSARSSSASRASCCPARSRTCRAASPPWSSTSTRSSRPRRPRRTSRRSPRCPPRRRTCRSSSPRRCPRATCATRSSPARARCSSRSRSSTTTGGPACRTARSP